VAAMNTIAVQSFIGYPQTDSEPRRSGRVTSSPR
jgi:hypothetical protein